MKSLPSTIYANRSNGRQAVRILVAPEQRQQVLGGLQGVLGDGDDSRILVFLSTIVASIGLFEDNAAVVIGAIVIAPLLGPNIVLALGALLLLTVNIVCVNLSAKLVFLLRGIKPHAWIDEARARQSMTVYILLWVILLTLLLAVIAYRHYVYG